MVFYLHPILVKNILLFIIIRHLSFLYLVFQHLEGIFSTVIFVSWGTITAMTVMRILIRWRVWMVMMWMVMVVVEITPASISTSPSASSSELTFSSFFKLVRLIGILMKLFLVPMPHVAVVHLPFNLHLILHFLLNIFEIILIDPLLLKPFPIPSIHLIPFLLPLSIFIMFSVPVWFSLFLHSLDIKELYDGIRNQ